MSRRRVFWVATAVIATDTLLFSLIVPALPSYADRFDLSDAEAALIFAAFPVAQLLASMAAAARVDRTGRRPAMLGGAVLLLAASVAFALAEHPGLLAAARAAQGAAAGLTWTGALAAISDVYPADQLGFRIGLAETAGGAAGLLGPIVGGVMIDAWGTEATFAAAAVLPALALAAVLTVPETRGAPAERGHLGPALRRLARMPGARAGALALALVAVVLALTEPLLPLDLHARLDLSPRGVGLVFAGGLAAMFLASPLAGRWSDRRGRRGPLVAGGLVAAAALPLVAVGPAWSVALAFAVVGAGIGTMGAPTGPLLAEAVDQAGMAGRYGVSSGVITVVFSAGYALGPLAGAGLRLAVPFWVTALVMAVAVGAATVGAGRMLSPEAAAAGGRPPSSASPTAPPDSAPAG